MRVLSLFALVAVFGAVPVYADTVEEATNQYFQIMKSENYAAAADIFDPSELQSFRASLSFMSNLPNASQEQFYSSFFGPGATQETVENLSDAEFFASFFGAAMSQANMPEIMRLARAEYLGHVFEGENVAHAVTRVSLETPEFSFEKISVASFVRRGDDWKMMMSGDIRGIADKIRTAVGM